MKNDVEEHYENDSGLDSGRSDFSIKKENRYTDENERIDFDEGTLDSVLSSEDHHDIEKITEVPSGLSFKGIVERKNGIIRKKNCTSVNRQTLRRNIQERMYKKLLNTSEVLVIYLQQDDLYKLQEELRKQGRIKENKLKWRKWNNSGDRRVFGCRNCPFKSDSKYLLLVHMVDNHKEVAKEKKLIESQYLMPGGRPDEVWFKCIECCFITKTKSTFENHMLKHKSIDEVSETFRCASCPFESKYKYGVIKHLKIHRAMNSLVLYKCPHCNFETKQQSYLDRHVSVIHQMDNVLKCDICSFKTKYIRSLQGHILTHNKTKLYKCTECPFQTSNIGVLKSSHRLTHTTDEARIYGCTSCSYKSKTKETLKKHLVTHKAPQHKCDLCPFQTKHKSYLRIHRLTHMDVKKEDFFSCEYCPHQSKSKILLRQHLKVHMDPSQGIMYKCDKCPYQSRTQHNVKRHSLLHMDRKDLPKIQCALCTYHCISRARLRAHCKAVHAKAEDIKWKVCEHCGFKTKTGGNLKRHLLVHADPEEVNQYKCSHCPFASKTKQQLQSHMPKHMNVYLHCDSCDFKTKYKSTLISHKKRLHKA